MVNISDSAKKKLISLIKEEGLSPNNTFIRLSISNKGCSGFYYDLSFDKTQKKDDNIYDLNEIKILIDKKYECYLDNIMLEYNGGLQGKGFVFKNPNAIHTCGCGKSFSI